MFLFGDSLRKNLLWPDTAARDEEIKKTLDVLGIGELIAKLPQGLDTQVGERGISFSGGERQRICLTRAILRNPQLLILDEATNAIDYDSESKIYEALRALRENTTIVVISHRSTSLLDADLTIEVKNGNLSVVLANDK